MKPKDKMITAIRGRRDLDPPRISLRKLLASGGMEHYLNLCTDRLAEELKIDGEDTAFNFADFPDVLFTSDGFFDCRRVLENYLPVDALIDAWEALREIERENENTNNLAAAFRKMELRELLEIYKNQKLSESAEAGQLVRKWIAVELWSRSFFSGICRKASEALTQLYVSWKYRGLFDIMREVAERYSSEMGKD